MLIDVNAYIGHYPFRQVGNMDPEGLIKIMDEAGIDIACVSSINSVFYRDTQQGNEELARQIAPYKGRLIPFAIINPSYTGWKKDFLRCINELGMKGLELYPNYHNYSLNSESCAELVKLAGEMEIPVHIPYAIENIRQRHWMDVNETISMVMLNELFKLCPDTDFIITNASGESITPELAATVASRRGRVYCDFTKFDTLADSFDQLLKMVGADRIVFGSVAPMQYVEPQLVKLHYAGISETDREKIMSGNLKSLLKL